MRGHRLWTMAIVVLAILAATKYVSAQVKTRAISQLTGDDATNTVTFRVRIRNISGDSDLPTLFAPGVWVLHSEASPLFASSEASRGDILKALAREGDPATWADALRAQGFPAGVFDTPVCADGPGPLPSERADEFGGSYEFEVTASPDTPYLSFATMLIQSNDQILVSGENGIALFDEDGSAIGVQYVTDKLLLWNARTKSNGESNLNTGSANEKAKERSVDDGFTYPNIADLVEVYISPNLMVDRDMGRQLPPPADHQLGETFQVGDVQWQVHSAEILGDKLTATKNTKKMLTTDERFVLVRFSFLNLGSDPLEFDGGPRNRKGVPLRDDQGREYTYHLEPRSGLPDNPLHDYVPEDENCYGKRRFGRWRPFVLKPNSPTTCSTIYEVSADATNLVFVASELGEDEVGAAETVDLNLPSVVSPHSIGENVSVGDVRWNVHSAEDLGHVLEEEEGKLKTKHRFVRVRFNVQNKGSETLRFDVVEDVKLRDSLGREHEHYLVPRIGPDRYPEEVIPDDEECRDYELKPNVSATCTAIYEVDEITTGLLLAAGHLGGTESGVELIDLGLPSRKAISINSVNEDVEVGDMCWRVLSAENLGRVLKNNGDEESTDGKFIQVRFRILNLGSETFEFDDADAAALVDKRGRIYPHYHIVRDLWPDRHPVEFIPDNEECYHIDLKANIPTTCTMIYDVADDSENSFLFLASDLEGYETALVSLSPEMVASCTEERRPISVGKHEVCEEVAPGIYRGKGSEESPCLWARLDSFEAGFESVIATRTHDGQFYVEILDSDAAFSTDCNLEPIDKVIHPVPRLTSLPPGMYLVDKDIAPSQYEGTPSVGLYCFWQRLNCVTGEEDCAVDWGLEGEKYQVEVSATDLAVEFACQVEKVLPDFQRIYDSRLGYSLAVPDGWHVIDLQSVNQHPFWGTFSKVYPVAAKGIEDVLASSGGENIGYLAVELDLIPKPSIKTIAIVGTTPLADDIPAETVVQLLGGLIESFDMFPVGVPVFAIGTTNGLHFVQGVVMADLSSQGLFNAHAVVTALRANDTAYILLVATEAKNAKAKQPLIGQIIGTFRPE